ncbi:hypothetical protein ACFULT_26455 [Rhodococcus sp. NPDC057297]|uniref:hypothetical protein n=1 Tax=Rhodococcus sp. NPDC057297 TaxID=3346090 RepID=UPI00362D1AE3
MSVSPVTDMSTSDDKRQALELLAILRQRQEATRLHRIHCMRLARQHGATHFEIGAELGVSEAAVRGMLKRAGSENV